MEQLALMSSLPVVFLERFPRVFLPVQSLITASVKHTVRVEILDNLQGASGVVIVAKEDLIIYPLV